MKTIPILRTLALVLILTSSALHAQVPQIINYQGRVAVGTTNFDGSGAFKFALVDAAGTTSYWSNDGTSTAGSEPTSAVSLTVTKGLYSVLLGDTALGNMTAIPNTVFANSDVRLRVWFDDGTANGSQLLSPDQRISAVGYAMVAGALQAGANISAGAVTATSFTGSGASLTELPIPTATNFLFGYSTVTMTAGVPNTFFNVIFTNPASHNSGWVYNGGTGEFTSPATGLYLIRYDGQLVSSGGAAKTVSLRSVVNGVEIPGSQSAATLASSNVPLPVSQSFMATLNAGDTLAFQWATDNLTASLLPVGQGTTPRSFSCTIIRLQ